MQKFSILLILLSMLILQLDLTAKDEQEDAILVTGVAKHEVKKGETLYSISRHYQVTVDGLLYANRNLNEDFVIHPGDVLLIPDDESLARLAAVKPNCQVIKCKYHVVQQGETLYSISKKYADLSVEKLLELNELTSSVLQPGQELIVAVIDEQIVKVEAVKQENDHWAKAKEKLRKEALTKNRDSATLTSSSQPLKPTSANQKFSSVADIIQHYKSIFDSYDDAALTERKERCVANYLDEEPDNSSYFALYDHAAIGSVLKVRNLMNNNIVYLRVVGSVPELDTENSINLKISNSAARKLNVLDEKFQAEVVAFVR